MGRLGTEGWAGVAMLVIAVAVSLPALLGIADPLIPRPLWALLLVAYVLSVLASGARREGPLRATALALAVVLSWVLVLTVPGMGLLLILVVVTAAISTYVVTLPVSLVLVVLNTGVVALTISLSTGEWIELVMLPGFYLLIQVATVFSTATLLREKRMRSELAGAQVELRAAGVLLEESARTAERLRISRELHDLIGHQLTVLTLNLEAARHLEGPEARRHVDKADQVARELLGDVRATVGEMRTRPTDLESALRSLVEGVPGLEVEVAVDDDLRLGEEQRTAFLRLAQEAVTNTIRHAEATWLLIEVTQEQDGVALLVRDDGIGARPLQLGNGLRGLRERFEQLGGEVTVESRRGFAVCGRLAAS